MLKGSCAAVEGARATFEGARVTAEGASPLLTRVTEPPSLLLSRACDEPPPPKTPRLYGEMGDCGGSPK